jgi:hypothetical protein
VSNIFKILENELERLRKGAVTVKLRNSPGTSLGGLTLTVRTLYQIALGRSNSKDKEDRIVYNKRENKKCLQCNYLDDVSGDGKKIQKFDRVDMPRGKVHWSVFVNIVKH